jgi:hypothetical protein
LSFSRWVVFGTVLFILALLVARSGSGSSGAVETPESQVLTPLIMSVQDAPVPFVGSDGNSHLVYEVWMTNFTSSESTVEQVQVLGDDSNVLQTLDAAKVAGRLQPAGQRTSTGTIAAGAQSLLFVHVILAGGVAVPKHLTHRVTASIRDREFVETGATTPVNSIPVALFGPPLHGDNYISADSCCDATRHTRAALPVNGRVWVAQRYAVDWEQLDSTNRIYVGPKTDVNSYKIYGAQIFAVAKATVVAAVDGLPDQVPGKFPENPALEDADGNHVTLDLGGGNFALYAHMKPGSVLVHVGQTVTPGQVIGLVGNSGNSIAPHMHFQVTNGPLTAASNGLPYEINSFRITAISPGTAAFDKAEADGTPLEVTPVSPPQHVTNALPLDQLIISFAP